MMFLYASTSAGLGNEAEQAKGAIDALTDQFKALGENVIPTTADKMVSIVKTLQTAVVNQENLTSSSFRNLGFIRLSDQAAINFGKKIQSVYYDSMKMGVSFKDVSETVDGLGEQMGRVVNPSQETIKAMVSLHAATGMASKEVGKMVADLVKVGGTSLDATKNMHEMAVNARQVGLNANKFMTTIQSNLKNLSGFGFKNGVEGLKGMVKQAMLLRTNIESIGAMKVQSTALDPEGAIDLAAKFQMLGGAVGKLADPFQLMYMAQNDVEGLQKELVNSAKAAATFNKETGKFDIATEDMYRLREQATLTGANLEDVVNTAKEGAKLDFIKEKLDLGDMDEESKSLISSLSEIDASGKITFDLPGFDEQNQSLEDIMKNSARREEFEEKLKEYQDKAAASEEEIAISQLTVQETMARDITMIKDTFMRLMSSDERETLLKETTNLYKKGNQNMMDVANVAGAALKNVPTAVTTGLGLAADQLKPPPTVIDTATTIAGNAGDIVEKGIEIMKGGNAPVFPDAMFPASGEAPKVLSKGKLYSGIVGDDVAMGVGLGDALNKVSSGQGAIGGKLDININVGGQVNGDDRNQISKIFDNPQVQKQIMDTVLYKLESYKKQQGVLA